MWTSRMYMVASPELCSALQRAPSTLSLDPVISEITSRMVDLNPRTASILRDPSGGQDGGVSLYKQSHSILTPQTLTDGSDIQLGYLGQLVNDVKDGSEVELFRFVRKKICDASNRTFFGPKNPFEKYPDLLDSFWDWESGIIPIMVGFFPRITARKAYQGLMTCAKAFAEYIEVEGYREAHYFLQNRNSLHLQHGITDTIERGKLDVSMGLAINVNASITTFWLLSNVFSRPELLSRLRYEIRKNALLGPGLLSFECLRQSCPFLNSVYRETLRLYAPMGSPRWVAADTMLADTYLVRKGTLVQTASNALHQNRELWGPDVESFKPNRFLYSINGSKTNPDGSVPEDKAHALHPATFRSFGGGKHMCPGRHFAQCEIISLSAVLLLAFDMEAIDGTDWNPPPDTKRTPISVMRPLKELKVRLQRRKEFENIKWKLEL
ncbi:cytochrome P450 [Macroventuria anomochaeta]|uniref:Cytochrome P450 n=1 Tax=Macroventuria anomochaeta TaxID=301207 RepID=A0ACB6RZJ1_9PLEO|nr:cytochrome P450 [Macroventuria anomochaeta]KAF2626573.1 cytochrome P450 [Macroventuria anomochaeta]